MQYHEYSQLKDFKDIKTLSGFNTAIKDLRHISIQEVMYNKLYSITIGCEQANLFIKLYIDPVNKPTIDIVEREFNGKNYTLGRELSLYVTKHGKDALIKTLNDLRGL